MDFEIAVLFQIKIALIHLIIYWLPTIVFLFCFSVFYFIRVFKSSFWSDHPRSPRSLKVKGLKGPYMLLNCQEVDRNWLWEEMGLNILSNLRKKMSSVGLKQKSKEQHYQLFMTGFSIYYKIISLAQNYQQFGFPATLFKSWPSKLLQNTTNCAVMQEIKHMLSSIKAFQAVKQQHSKHYINAQLPAPYLVCHSTSSFARSLRAALCFSSSLSFSLLATSSKRFNKNSYLAKWK